MEGAAGYVDTACVKRGAAGMCGGPDAHMRIVSTSTPDKEIHCQSKPQVG
jgi:hypothetical protein